MPGNVKMKNPKHLWFISSQIQASVLIGWWIQILVSRNVKTGHLLGKLVQKFIELLEMDSTELDLVWWMNSAVNDYLNADGNSALARKPQL